MKKAWNWVTGNRLIFRGRNWKRYQLKMVHNFDKSFINVI